MNELGDSHVLGFWSCFGVSLCSEVLAAESVTCLNKALHHLKDIWEEIGISEDQRLQRTNVVKSHIKVIVLLTFLAFHNGRNARHCRFLLCYISKNKLDQLCCLLFLLLGFKSKPTLACPYRLIGGSGRLALSALTVTPIETLTL